MELTFNQLLAEYLSNCISFKQRLSRDNVSESDRIYIKGQIRQNLYDFRTIRDYLNTDEVFECKKANKSEVKKYKIDGDFPVVRILKYRGEIIPIYLDDYGQQEFGIYKNKEISGGSYNGFPEYNFICEIDSYLEKEFFESDLDESVEWKKLKRLWKKELLEDIK